MSGVLVRLFLFLLPFVLFATWLWVMKRTRLGDGRIAPATERKITLACAGLILVTVAGFVVYGLSGDSGDRDRTYVPPSTVDGEIRPGRFKENSEAEEGGPADDESDG